MATDAAPADRPEETRGIFGLLGLTDEQIAEVEADLRAEFDAIAEAERQAYLNSWKVWIR